MAGVSPVILASVGTGLANAQAINQFNKRFIEALEEFDMIVER